MARQRRGGKASTNSHGGSGHPLHSKLSNKGTNQQKWNIKLLIFVMFNVIIVLSSIVYLYFSHQLENIVITPIDSPKIIENHGLNVPEKYWGSYRGGLYFGLKTRTPKSLVVGLMWFSQKIIDNSLQIRHWCNQWDKLKKYGWLKHDGLNFGIQDIEEEEFIIHTSFVKKVGGNYGGDWTARITVESKLNITHSVPISLLFYTATNGDGLILPKVVDKNQLTEIHGETEHLGRFTIRFLSDASNGGTILKYNYLSTIAPEGLATLKEVILQKLVLFQSKKGNLQLLGLVGHSVPPTEQSKSANFIVHQVTILPPFQMEVMFESEDFVDRQYQLTGDIYDRELLHHKTNFDEQFENIFKLTSKGYSEKEILAAQAIFSNLIGGISYFYGSSLVQSKYNKEPVEYREAPLYTAVPSRSFFPRGFLWDEGFHNLLISRWDANITKEILGHWFDTMNSEGWIPREQILGLEARARVPKEFIVQKNTNANPPTFFLTIDSLIKRTDNQNLEKDKAFLKHLYPRLKAWFLWFNTTQNGKLPGTYRWRGRDSNINKELNPKTLTSGLDDYPRASHPTITEYHVDLRCWIALAAGILGDIAQLIGEPSDEFVATNKYLTDNQLLDKLHWSPTSQSYCDFGLHTDNIKLIHPKPPHMPPGHPVPKMEMVRYVKDEPTYKFVNNLGYVSLFPFLLKIVKPDNAKLGKILKDMRDPNLLWTNFGLRSLSKKSPLYMEYNTEHDPPYWRGTIWININYMALQALHYYSKTPGPSQEQAFNLYTELRKNLVTNILSEYKRTGYIWEQYNDKTGKGHGSHPFTGWSSLVVLIMAEIF
ncbi:mannosyl-oligosaccharide glucosidase [Centruroides vittatus]|uniref:mannosyl-oligosaccharide glucosidase n=1 Tax=Centruroides vittatus TaxID=120091 RepID=UPI00350F1439